MSSIATGLVRSRAAQLFCALAAVSLLLCGCGKKADVADNAGTRLAEGAKKTGASAPQASAAALASKSNLFLSIFSTNDPRDPFNPKSRPKAAPNAVITGVDAQTDQQQLIAAVQAGFQGIYGSEDERELLVHGVLMREKRDATVTVPVGGQNRRIKLRAVRIYRNTAEVQIEGVPQTITLPKNR